MGFKKTSDTIAISFGVSEAAPNTFVQEEIALQLDVLNNEIFVVLACDIDLTEPDAVAATNTLTRGSLTTTTSAIVASLNNTNCVATAKESIRASGFVDGGVGFSRVAAQSYTGDVDYISLIATNNFFIQLEGLGNGTTKSLTGRIWGYRARADASTYAALVQSEVLSA
jgi:hypothetical protein